MAADRMQEAPTLAGRLRRNKHWTHARYRSFCMHMSMQRLTTVAYDCSVRVLLQSRTALYR